MFISRLALIATFCLCLACSSGAPEGTIVAAVAQLSTTLDPHKLPEGQRSPVLDNIYETLVAPQDNLEFAPALASDVQASADKKTWTFTLRDGVTFHDGSAFTAEDVVFSYRRILDEGLPGAGRLSVIQDLAAKDDATVEIVLKEPSAILLSALGSSLSAAIVPAEFDAEMAKSPVGTGPFRFSKGGDAIELVPNGDYWGTKPQARGVHFRVSGDPAAVLEELEDTSVHWTNNAGAQQPEEGMERTMILATLPSPGYVALVPNAARQPFDRAEVRQALGYAVDRTAVIDAALPKLAQPIQTAIPQTSPFAIDYAPFEQDLEKAKSLLKTAGAESLRLELIVVDPSPRAVKAAETIVAQLGEAGIDATLASGDPAAARAAFEEGAFDVALVASAGNLDPDDYYGRHHSGAPQNYHGYSEPTVDSLLDKARVETEAAARQRLYDQIARRVADDAAYIYVYNPLISEGWAAALQGYSPRADGSAQFGEAVVAEK